MQRNEPKEVTFPESERSDPLAQAERVDARAIRSLQVLDLLPTEACVPIDPAPVHRAQATQRRDDLLQFLGLEAKEDILELRAIEIERDPPSACGHADGPLPLRLAPEGYLGRLPSALSWRPRRDRARSATDLFPGGSRAGSLAPRRPQ